jgi:hypothetical protein
MSAEWQEHICPLFSHNRPLQVDVVVMPYTCNRMVLLLIPPSIPATLICTFFLFICHCLQIMLRQFTLPFRFSWWVVNVLCKRSRAGFCTLEREAAVCPEGLVPLYQNACRSLLWLNFCHALLIFRKPHIHSSIWRPSLRLRYDSFLLILPRKML